MLTILVDRNAAQNLCIRSSFLRTFFKNPSISHNFPNPPNTILPIQQPDAHRPTPSGGLLSDALSDANGSIYGLHIHLNSIQVNKKISKSIP